MTNAYLPGVLAGAATLAAGELAAAVLPGGRSPVSGMGRTAIDLTPGMAVDMTVATAEALDKPLLAGTLTAGWLGAGVLAARSGRRGGLVLLGLGAMSGAAAARRPQSSSASSLAAGLFGGIVGATVLRQGRADRGAPADMLATGLLTAASGGAARVLRRRQAAAHEATRSTIALPPAAHPASPVPAAARFDVAGLSPLLTPVERFYVTDVTFPTPRVDPSAWRLRVDGLVDRPLSLSLDELLAMELTELDATLVCVHNPVGGPRIGTGRWLGVPVADVLARAGVLPGAEQLLARSVDGFSAGVPLRRISADQDALIVVGLNGEPLPVAHGFPARLLVPGLWGADANTKWLDALELTTWDAVSDYWDARGWPREPSPVRPGSRIDVPAHRGHVVAGSITVAGVAWAPPEGVEEVEVAIDGGAWQRAELAAELAPTAWRQWRLSWDVLAGEHRLGVRTLGRAARQPSKLEPPYPQGSGGYQEIRVWVHEQPPAPTPLRTLGDGAAEAGRRLALASMAPPAWIAHRSRA